MENLIVVRDGSGGFAYIGECDLPEQEIINTRVAGGMIKLTNARTLITLTMGLGPGRVGQDTHIFPLDGEFGSCDVWVHPASFHYPNELARKGLLELVKECERNEVNLRARAAGLAT